MTPAQRAIAEINDHKLLLPTDRLNALAVVITRAALDDDMDAQSFCWLLNWKPTQLKN